MFHITKISYYYNNEVNVKLWQKYGYINSKHLKRLRMFAKISLFRNTSNKQV